MKLYVLNENRLKKDTLYTFLYRVLNLNCPYSKGYCNKTFTDAEFLETQCNSRSHRSFDDIVLISKTYFKVSNKQVAKTLLKFLISDPELCFIFCDTANKWIFHTYNYKSKKYKYCGTYSESETKIKESGGGKYSFEDFLYFADLTLQDVKLL